MKVLVVAPHMDDEVLGCGGTIARHVRQGDEVMVAFCANRVYGHQFDQQAFEAEKANALEAQKVLGYAHAEFLGLPDERLDGPVQDILKAVEPVYFDFGPDVVYTCFWGDNNQDHRGVFAAMRVVLRPWSAHPPRQVILYEVPSSTDQSPPIPAEAFLPNHYVNVDDSIDLKLAAMRCYERESRVFPHPRSEEGIRVFARKRGMECGFHHAEAFTVTRQFWA